MPNSFKCLEMLCPSYSYHYCLSLTSFLTISCHLTLHTMPSLFFCEHTRIIPILKLCTSHFHNVYAPKICMVTHSQAPVYSLLGLFSTSTHYLLIYYNIFTFQNYVYVYRLSPILGDYLYRQLF